MQIFPIELNDQRKELENRSLRRLYRILCTPTTDVKCNSKEVIAKKEILLQSEGNCEDIRLNG